jgi:D-proline reductase (dithiol) PrdB
MTVDSFKFLPRVIATYYQMTDRQPELPIPWSPLSKPLNECKFGLVTTAGIYHRLEDSPFDLEREKREPTWGDPTFRVLPTNLKKGEAGISHLHINTEDILKDFNIQLPIQRFQELLADGTIGGLAERAYSFMGYQGFPPDTSAWEGEYGPGVAEALKSEGVDCVLLTPA